MLSVCCAITLALLASGCEPLGRPGAPCATTDTCAWGLVCVDEHCHRPDDEVVVGISPFMRDLPRRGEPPKGKGDVPPLLIELALRSEGGIEIELLTSRVLPETVQTEELLVQPAKAVKRFEARVKGLSQQVSGVKLSISGAVQEAAARSRGVGVLRSDTGAVVIAGARLAAGDVEVTIPFLGDPALVDGELGAALWQLDLARSGRLRVGVLCAANAFCPTKETPPKPPGGEWPAPVAAGFEAVYAPFDSIRTELIEEFREAGLEPVAVTPGGSLPEGVNLLVLAAPLAAVSAETVAWLDALRARGVGLLVLLAGARFVASAGKLVVVDSGGDALLERLGVSFDEPLLADRAALIPFRAPNKLSPTSLPLPLAAEVFKVEAAHGAVSGLSGLVLPLAGSLTTGGGSANQVAPVPVLRSRLAVSPVALPSEASQEALQRTAPATGAGNSRVLAVAGAPSSSGGRVIVVGSALGVESMSASTLLESLQLTTDAVRSNPASLLRRLAPYAVASQAYLDTLRANRALRLRVFKLLTRLVRWVGVPPRVRGGAQAAPR